MTALDLPDWLLFQGVWLIVVITHYSPWTVVRHLLHKFKLWFVFALESGKSYSNVIIHSAPLALQLVPSLLLLSSPPIQLRICAWDLPITGGRIRACQAAPSCRMPAVPPAFCQPFLHSTAYYFSRIGSCRLPEDSLLLCTSLITPPAAK